MMKKTIQILMMLVCVLAGHAQEANDYSANQNPQKNQAVLTLQDGSRKYYDTESVNSIDIDGAKVTVNQQAGSYTFKNNVTALGFNKGNADTKVLITEAKGWLESAYVKFTKLTGIRKYNVYVNDKLIDTQLVRDYGSYGRADAVGLAAGTYTMKVVPVADNNQEISACAAEVKDLVVKNYSREGFAFKDGYAPGAYNSDGTLKKDAKVFYVTKNTAKTISTTVITDTKGGTTECIGLQAIITAYEKGCDTTPIAFRFVGLVTKNDLDAIGSKEEGIQVKGRKADSELNMTFEGIGDDATIKGFGFLVRNSKGVEFRNFGIMRCMDDGLSLDTDNSNIWIHHMDVFYGPNGGGDHSKGDGAVDVKSDSKLVTVSYNHFWDTGKSNMFGMKSESGPNYISYDHNWFDHSDSRHPRVRTMSVHVWNNYFDNVAKYGVGATSGASVFVENNYFLKTKKPILSSLQGTDAQGDGTFSGEDGGMIKAYGNYFDRTATNFRYYTQRNPSEKGYDAYETESRDEQVPETEKTLVGGTTYNNFDTNASVMYAYTPVLAADVPGVVMGYYGAGRMNHGDFSYTFPDNVGNDTTDSAYDSVLGGQLDNYQSSLVGIFGDENASTDDDNGGEQGGEVTPTPTDAITCSFTKDDSVQSSAGFFTINGNYSNSKGQATVDGVVYTCCLKVESATSVEFTVTRNYTMTLWFADGETASIKINGNKISGSGSIYSQTLEAGSYELTKDKSVNLFYIKLEPVE